jgi:hypothetical protein
MMRRRRQMNRPDRPPRLSAADDEPAMKRSELSILAENFQNVMT